MHSFFIDQSFGRSVGRTSGCCFRVHTRAIKLYSQTWQVIHTHAILCVYEYANYSIFYSTLYNLIKPTLSLSHCLSADQFNITRHINFCAIIPKSKIKSSIWYDWTFTHNKIMKLKRKTELTETRHTRTKKKRHFTTINQLKKKKRFNRQIKEMKKTKK